jgi:hypothetical protein
MKQEVDMKLNNINSREMSTRTLLFVVDTACNIDLNGKYLETVNSAIKNVISNICTIQEKCDDMEFNVAVLEFYGETAKLRPPTYSPQNVSQFTWVDLECKNNHYGANIGIAFRELNEKNFFENYRAEHLPPTAVVLIANSGINDNDDYKRELGILRGKPQFNSAFKAAIAVGDGVKVERLNEITGNKNNVVVVRKSKELSECIREIAIRGTLYGLNIDENGIRQLLEKG